MQNMWQVRKLFKHAKCNLTWYLIFKYYTYIHICSDSKLDTKLNYIFSVQIIYEPAILLSTHIDMCV